MTKLPTTEELFPDQAEHERVQFRHEFGALPVSRVSKERLYTVQGVLASLERAVKALGSVAAVSRHFDISRTYLTMVLKGQRKPSRYLLDKLGYIPVALYYRRPGTEGMQDAETTEAAGREDDSGAGEGDEGADESVGEA